MGTGKQRVLHFTGKRRITAGRVRRQFRLLGTEGTTSPEEDLETDCVNVTHGSWSGTEGETGFNTASRRGEEDSHRTAHSRHEACDDEFLWSHCQARRRKGREMSMAAHLATLLAGTQTPLGQRLMEKHAAHGTGSQIRNTPKPCSCTATVFLLVGPFIKFRSRQPRSKS